MLVKLDSNLYIGIKNGPWRKNLKREKRQAQHNLYPLHIGDRVIKCQAPDKEVLG